MASADNNLSNLLVLKSMEGRIMAQREILRPKSKKERDPGQGRSFVLPRFDAAALEPR